MYKLLRILVWGGLRNWFRKMYVSGRQNVPQQGPVILACNHPNTFLDGMVAAKFQPHTAYMLARGDAFRSKIANKLLRWIYLVPIYRLKEGAEHLSKNDESFRECFEILRSKGTILIFSEGFSIQNWQLLPLKKGTARLAFGAEAFAGGDLGLKVVPVGINYTNFTHPGQLMMLNYGEPVEVDTYFHLFKENSAKAYLAFNQELEKKMRDIVLEMPEQLEKSSQKLLLNIHLNEFNEPADWLVQNEELFNREKNFSKHLHEILQDEQQKQQLEQLLQEYSAELRSVKISDAALAPKRRSWNVLSLILLFPLWLLGWLLHLPPLLLANRIPEAVLKDKSFVPSAWFAMRMIFVPIWYLLLLVLILIFEQWWTLLMLSLLPILGYFSFRYSLQGKLFLQKQRLKSLRKHQPKKFTKLVELRGQLMNMI